MLHRRSRLSLLLLALLLGASADAQQSGNPQSGDPRANDRQRHTATREPTGFVLAEGSHDLVDLIGRAARYLGLNILVDPAEVSARGGSPQIEITRAQEVDARGCWELLNALLCHKGFAIVPLDLDKGFHEVLCLNGPRAREIYTGARFVPAAAIDEFQGQGAVPIVTCVLVEHVHPMTAVNTLRPFFSTGGGGVAGQGLVFSSVGDSSLLILGMGAQVHAACRMLAQCDVRAPDDPGEVQVVRLEHARAEEVADAVRSLLAPGPQMTAQGAPIPAVTLRVAADPALQAVLLSGTPARIRAAAELAGRLDQPAATPRPVPHEVAATLEALERRVAGLEQALRKASENR